MTMHKAKGLEFETVILLGIGRDPPSPYAQALHWLERVAAAGTKDLLLAPTLADEESERLTAFVRNADAERNRAERARLLYVATTRARERLHVVCQLSPVKPKPGSETMLALLWPTVGAQLEALAEHAVPAPAGDAESVEPVLRRLLPRPSARARVHGREAQFALPFDADPIAADDAPAPRPEFSWASPAAAHIGTVVHRQLQAIAEVGVESWSAAAIEQRSAVFRHELQLLGVDRAELAAATARAGAALRAAVEDPEGRWVLAKHPEARSELRLTLRVGERLEHIRLDRTFVADGTRWIIDFKTSLHEGADREAFLASEVERYRPQLDRYAAALAVIDPRPVQVALYFPLLRTLRAWAASR
jgi:ATP-dependent helicase/nuclease subunit A